MSIVMKKNTNFQLFLISLISAMGGLLFGYDWVVIGGAKPFYEQFFQIANEPMLQGWAMSSALIGCLIGALAAGKLSDCYGRKPILIIAAALFVSTSVGTGLSPNFTWFNVFRLIGGFAIGAASSLSPMYIAEIAPAKLRGRFVAINQLTVVLGILAAQLVNWMIAEPVPADATAEFIRMSWNGQTGWRLMFIVMTIPAGLFFSLGFVLPESPRWLVVNGKRESALKILTKLVGLDNAEIELQAIESNMHLEEKASFKQLLHPSLRKVLIIGIVLAVFQQWCGINVIFNYAQEIFMSAGFGVSDVLLNIVITGVVNVIFTVIAMYFVDKWGRKALLLLGAFGLTLIYALMGAAYYFHISGFFLLVIVVLAIACYAMTLAPVMWIVISEIYPNKIRGIAMSVATFALWTACFILTYTFPLLNKGLGAAGTFWLYGLICLLGGIFVMRSVPETKGKTLEELENELIKK
ncbi:MAG: sugar porter family MFS transporter [Paludibacter sp.]